MDSAVVVSREHIQCDGPGCIQWNPQKRCSRCQCRFYCGADCQKSDWVKGKHKNDCTPAQLKKKKEGLPNGILWRTILAKKMFNVEEEDLDVAVDAVVTALQNDNARNSDCCICMKDPIESPLVLKGCRHAFCGACLLEWQRQQRSFQLFQNIFTEGGYQEEFQCPICRESTVDANDLIIYKAGMYQSRARRSNEEDQSQYLQRAIQEISNMLAFDAESKVPEIFLYFMKVELLNEIGRGEEALKLLQQAIQINRDRNEHMKQMNEEADNLRSGDRSALERLRALEGRAAPAIRESERTKAGMAVLRGSALLCNEEYEKARDCYNSVLPLFVSPEVTVIQKRKIYKGLVQCALAAKDYAGCIEACDAAFKCDRHAQGFYQYKAQSQRAMGQVAEAIQTMNVALVYETPWDEKNLQHLADQYNELIEG